MPDQPFHYRQRQLHIDDVPLDVLADAVGTPVYVYSQRRLLTQLAALNAAFAPLDPGWFYSLKANANGHLVRALVRAGVPVFYGRAGVVTTSRGGPAG